MVHSEDRKNTVAQLVQGVLEDRIGAHEAVSKWPSIDSETNPLIKELWHRLMHFIDDADLRREDHSYAEAQRRHLRRLLEDLRDT